MSLGLGQSVGLDSLCDPTAGGSSDTAIQWASLPRPQEPEPTCMASRASTIQEQGFSGKVAAKIEARQRLSTRAVYKSKWAVFVKWFRSNEVDFWLPSVSSNF